jgi:hypothetical protein
VFLGISKNSEPPLSHQAARLGSTDSEAQAMTIEKTPATAGDGRNPTRGAWQVRIHGWQTDLEHLARHFASELARVTKDKDGFLYESDAFTACDTSAEVLAVAEEELKQLSGVLRLRGSHESVRTDGTVFSGNSAGGARRISCRYAQASE